MTGFHRGVVVADRVCHDEEVQLGKTSWQMPRHDRFLDRCTIVARGTEGNLSRLNSERHRGSERHANSLALR
jgi:hypothetical protein